MSVLLTAGKGATKKGAKKNDKRLIMTRDIIYKMKQNKSANRLDRKSQMYYWKFII